MVMFNRVDSRFRVVRSSEIDHLFERDHCSLNEELEYEKLDNSRETFLVKLLLKLCFNIVSLKLGECEGQVVSTVKVETLQERQIKLKNVLIISTPFQDEDKSTNPTKRSLFSRLIHFTWILLAAYIVLKFTILSILQFKLDSLMEISPKQVRKNATATWNNCALAEDIYFETIEDFKQYQLILAITRWIGILGSNILLKGAGEVAYGISGLIIVVFFFLSMVTVNFEKFRLDRMSFILNRAAERARINSDLSKIINCLIDGVRCHLHDKLVQGCKEVSEAIETRYNTLSHLNTFRDSKSNIDGNFKTVYSIETNQPIEARNDVSKDSFNFINILFQIHQMKLVKPANLHIQGHRQLLRLEFYWLLTTISTTLLIFPLIGILTILFDVNLRVMNRLEQLECSRWRPTGVVIQDYSQLPPFATEEHRNAFLSFDGSLEDRLRLIALEFQNREAGYLLFGIEIFSSISIGSIMVSFYSLIGALSSIDKILWLGQIQRQLDACNQVMANLFDLEKNKQSNPQYKGRKSIDNESSNRNKLLKELTITYLNFELFRRQQASHGKLIYFSLAQLSTYLASILLLCYIVGTTLKSYNNGLILFMSTFSVMFFNLPLLISAQRMSKIQMIMRSLTITLARGSQLSWLKQSHLLGLWRKQVLSENEVVRLFSSSLFGVNLTYQKVITLNAYLVVLWIILLKVSI